MALGWARTIRGAALLPLLAFAFSPAPALAQVEAPLETLVRSAADYGVANFYRTRNYTPIWISGGAVLPGTRHVVDILRRADLDGMEGGAALADGLDAALAQARSGRPEDLAAAELLLSSAWVSYVRTLRRPVNVGITYIDASLSPWVPFPAAILMDVATAPSLAPHLDAVSELNPLYGRLRAGLAAWKTKWERLPAVTIPAGPPLSAGSGGPRVRLVRERLGLAPDGAFDQAVAAAIREFKEVHGLPPTPVVDATTVTALNENRRLVENRLRLNLDRARGLPSGPGARFVLVDAASARLWLYENGQVRDSMKVIVGKTSAQTPMTAGLIRFAVVNPAWNVPPELVQRRIAPNVVRRGTAYLREKGYTVLSDWTVNPRVVDPGAVDWAAVAAGRLVVRIRQSPGADNAMGKMKFMFPNDFGVYLHDTPDKSLFSQSDRRLSSGCVRVEDAARLAVWLFGQQLHPQASEGEKIVPLSNPVPVYLNYFTAGWEGNTFGIRRDVYGRDMRAAGMQ